MPDSQILVNNIGPAGDGIWERNSPQDELFLITPWGNPRAKGNAPNDAIQSLWDAFTKDSVLRFAGEIDREKRPNAPDGNPWPGKWHTRPWAGGPQFYIGTDFAPSLLTAGQRQTMRTLQWERLNRVTPGGVNAQIEAAQGSMPGSLGLGATGTNLHHPVTQLQAAAVAPSHIAPPPGYQLNPGKWQETIGEFDIHEFLDLAGLYPVLGEAADLTNGLLYLLEGDCENALFSFAAVIPFLGTSATGAKWAKKLDNAQLDKELEKTTRELLEALQRRDDVAAELTRKRDVLLAEKRARTTVPPVTQVPKPLPAINKAVNGDMGHAVDQTVARLNLTDRQAIKAELQQLTVVSATSCM